MKPKKIKNEHLIEGSIVLAIDKLTTDIKSSANSECNKERAETIKILCQAFELVRGGTVNYRGDWFCT